MLQQKSSYSAYIAKAAFEMLLHDSCSKKAATTTAARHLN